MKTRLNPGWPPTRPTSATSSAAPWPLSGGRTAEMFALRFLEGHSNAEIGGMFGVSPVVVAVTLHRARRQLQKEIQKLGGLK